MSVKRLVLLHLTLVLLLTGCNLPAGNQNTADLNSPANSAPQPPQDTQNEDQPLLEAVPAPEMVAGQRIQPAQIVYLGAFRLPEASGVSDWDYSGHGLTYYPDGDPQGAGDGYSGSLFGIGHDHQLAVSEISIPAPVMTKDPAQMNQAETLQPFVQLSEGLIDLESYDLPRAGLSWLPGENGGSLNFCYADHLEDGHPTHGKAQITLSQPNQQGLWHLDSFSNFTTCDYIFEIPADWAETYAPGMQLATGRFREGVWGGQGPALYAYQPTPEGDTIQKVVQLLMYGIQEENSLVIDSDENTRMDTYQLADHWTGGAWLTAGEESAVIFLGTKAMGRSWYGFANGVEWDYACADNDPPDCPDVPEWPYDNRGYWAEGYQAQLIFYDTDQLGAVARGELKPYHPQPYATLDLTPYLLNPELDFGNYKRDLVGSMAFDAVNGRLYILERLADESKSVVHVFEVVSP